MSTVGRILERISAADSDAKRDARILIAHVLGKRSPGALAREDGVSRDEEARFLGLWHRRLAGEPAQYLLGEWDFFGRTFRVDARALIPRPETEHLAEEAIREKPDPERIIDLGCGSGVLAVTLALELPRAAVLATDVSPAALVLSRDNARRHGVLSRVRLLASDWLAAVGRGRFDLAVSNPPYVSSGERDRLPRSVRGFEPHAALFAGEGGIAEIRRLLAELPRVMEPGGAFLFEFGFGQREAVEEEVRSRPEWELRRTVPDLASIPRVAVLRRTDPAR